MTDDCCKTCAFYNKDAPFECEMSDDIPVICSVKMRKQKADKRVIKQNMV